MFRRSKKLTKKMLANFKKAKEIYVREVVADIVHRVVVKKDLEAIVQFKNIIEKVELDIWLIKTSKN